MKTLSFCLVLVLAGAGFGWARRQQIVDLRRRNAELRQRAAEIQACKQAAEQERQTLVDTNELVRLREERSELMRLRSELGRLRQATRLDLPGLQQKAEKTLQQAAEEEKRGPNLLEERAAKLHSSLAHEFLEYCLLSPLKQLAQINGGVFPGSFAETERLLATLPSDRDQSAKWLRQSLSQTFSPDQAETELIGQSLSGSARDFEFVPAPGPRTVRGAPVVLLREIAARQLPDGRSVRWYGYTDGRTEEVTSPGEGSPDRPSTAAAARSN